MSSDPAGGRRSEGDDGQVDDEPGSASASASSSASGSESGPTPETRTREVVVPLEVYKRVTVFSTLFAIVAVVGGFVVLDRATDRATADLSEIDPLLALLGVGLMNAGSLAYAFSTRFRAEGMGNGNPKHESDEPSNDG